MNGRISFQIKKKQEDSDNSLALATWPQIYEELKNTGRCYVPYMDNRVYHALPGISSTELREFHYKGEYAFHFLQKNQKKIKKKHFAFGTLVHEIFLEPEKVRTISDHEIVSTLSKKYSSPRITKAYKEWKANAIREGHQVLTSEEDSMIREWKKTIASCSVDKLFGENSDIKKESAYFIIDEKTHLILKCKFDLINRSNGSIMDLKTTNETTPRGFEESEWNWTREVMQYGYHIQQSYYENIFMKFHNYEKSSSFSFLRLCKTPPYPVTIATIDKKVLVEANKAIEKTLSMIAAYYDNVSKVENYCNSNKINFIETKTTE